MTTETVLEQQLTALLNHYHAPVIRYQHLAFSSKSLLVLDELAQLFGLEWRTT
jgi:hypothetical protein